MESHVLRLIFQSSGIKFGYGLGRLCQLNQPKKCTAAPPDDATVLEASGALDNGRKVFTGFYARKASP